MLSEVPTDLKKQKHLLLLWAAQMLSSAGESPAARPGLCLPPHASVLNGKWSETVSRDISIIQNSPNQHKQIRISALFFLAPARLEDVTDALNVQSQTLLSELSPADELLHIVHLFHFFNKPVWAQTLSRNSEEVFLVLRNTIF